MVKVEWKGRMAFEAVPPSGNAFVMDAYPAAGGDSGGPTPVEALLSSLAACSAMDVISILQKKQQDVTAYRVEIAGDRIPEGTWPRPFTRIVIRHIVNGNNIDPAAVKRAVDLSDEKYCTVIATLRNNPEIVSEFVIE